MTTRGKIILTLLLLGVVGFGVYRWWDKIAPSGKSQTVSIDTDKMKKDLAAATTRRERCRQQIARGRQGSVACGRFGHPTRRGVSDYDKTIKDGKLIVQFPINVWPGWAPINCGQQRP